MLDHQDHPDHQALPGHPEPEDHKALKDPKETEETADPQVTIYYNNHTDLYFNLVSKKII